MKVKVLNESPERTTAVVFDEGEEIVSGLLNFAKSQNITAGRLTGIGALGKAVLGFFDFNQRDYLRIKVDEQTEVLSLIGNFAVQGEQNKLHAHIVLGRQDGTALGGHLLEGWAHPTLEVIAIESPNYLRRQIDDATGLPLIAQ